MSDTSESGADRYEYEQWRQRREDEHGAYRDEKRKRQDAMADTSMSGTYRNAEDLDAGVSCPNIGCGGYLRRSPTTEGYLCGVCEEVFVGR